MFRKEYKIKLNCCEQFNVIYYSFLQTSTPALWLKTSTSYDSYKGKNNAKLHTCTLPALVNILKVVI